MSDYIYYTYKRPIRNGILMLIMNITVNPYDSKPESGHFQYTVPVRVRGDQLLINPLQKYKTKITKHTKFYNRSKIYSHIRYKIRSTCI